MSERVMRLRFWLQTAVQCGEKLELDFQNGFDVGEQDLNESENFGKLLKRLQGTSLNNTFSHMGPKNCFGIQVTFNAFILLHLMHSI